MIRISILYPHIPGGRFDHAYYETVHIPLALDLLGDAVRSVSVERGVSPGHPWPDPTYTAVCHFDCDSVDAYAQAMLPHLARLQADLLNYSDRSAVVQVSEITVDADRRGGAGCQGVPLSGP